MMNIIIERAGGAQGPRDQGQMLLYSWFSILLPILEIFICHHGKNRTAIAFQVVIMKC